MASPTKAQIKAYRAAIQTALDKVAEEQGFDALQLGNIAYNDEGFHGKLSAHFKLDADQIEQKRKDLETLLESIGIDPSVTTVPFALQNKQFVVTEVKRTNVVVKCVASGEEYTYKIAGLQQLRPASSKRAA
jgi:hypothetical protein